MIIAAGRGPAANTAAELAVIVGVALLTVLLLLAMNRSLRRARRNLGPPPRPGKRREPPGDGGAG